MLRWWHPHARGRDTFYMRHARIDQKSWSMMHECVARAEEFPLNSPETVFSAADDLMLKTFVWFVIPNVCNLNLLVGRSKVSKQMFTSKTFLFYIKAQELFQWKSPFPNYLC